MLMLGRRPLLRSLRPIFLSKHRATSFYSSTAFPLSSSATTSSTTTSSTTTTTTTTTDEQRRLLDTLEYRDLQRLAKAHAHIKGNQTKKELIHQLSQVLPSTTLSPHTSRWSPPENNSTVEEEEDDALDWLAPDDVDVNNRRVLKRRPPLRREKSIFDKLHRASPTTTTSLLDPDAEFHDENYANPLKTGLETSLETSNYEVIPGVPLTADHIVHILADNNARNIQQYHQVRTDAEHYIIATGLSLRHVRSLKDALVHAAKKTKIPGLSSSNVAGSGRKSPLEHWEIIDLRDTMVHLMTDQGRELYDLEGLWVHGLTEKDMETF